MGAYFGTMLGRLPSLTMVRLLAALLLAAIGLQASQSFDPVVRPDHGSAFSATTYEVALAPQRRAEAVQAAVVPLPILPGITTQVPLATAAITPRTAPRPDSTGPPSPAILDRQPAPRAPPFA